jgi:ornithine cyclodeaminase
VAEQAVALFMPARVADDLGAKVVSVFPRNPGRNLPTVHGVVILLDATTGRPSALMGAAALTALRTAAASGLATDLLANAGARTAALIGTGAQAATHLLAVCAVRPVERVSVFSRDLEHVRAFIARMQPEVPARLLAAATPDEAVHEADVVCAATTSATPVFDGRRVKAGAHVNGVGSYTAQMQEVDAEVVRRAGRVFVDRREAALAEAGDVVVALRQGVIQETDLIELGAVAAGEQPGRTAPDAVTFFKSVGVAAQDVTAAGEVFRRALEMNLGVEVKL